MSPTTLYLMRHAQTDWNRDKRIQGQTDTRLTPQGEADACAWGEALASRNLELNQILTSDLTRTMQTAKRVAPGIPASTDPRLREQAWGSWVGRTIRQLRKDEGSEVERQERAAWEFRPGGGESRLEVLERAWAALRDAALRHPGENILVVTHLGVVKAVLYHLLAHGYELGAQDPVQKNALHRLHFDGETFTIAGLNELF